MQYSTSLVRAVIGALLLVFVDSGCVTAEHVATKPVRVLAHGERKLERHLPD